MQTSRTYHSTSCPPGQPHDGTLPVSRLVSRYGEDALAEGFVCIPVRLLRRASTLGLSPADLALVMQLWAYWWDGGDPHPTVATLASHVGRSARQVQAQIAGLVARGLITVTARRGADGAQLANAYNLRPLLAQISESPADGCVPTLMPSAGMGVKPVAPKIDPVQPDLSTMIDTPCDAPIEHCSLRKSDILAQTLAVLAAEIGDNTPAESLRRVQALGDQAGMDAPATAKLLTRAAARMREASPALRNSAGMPYLLAVAEGLLREVPPAHRARRRESPRSMSGVDTSPTAVIQELVAPDNTAGASAPPLWHAVKAELASVLAPGVLRMWIDPLAARLEDTVLVLKTPTALSCQWIERHLRGRLTEALASVGAAGVTLVLRAPGSPPSSSA